MTPRRPRLVPSFTVAVGDGAVWLVAGEDVRYRLGTDGDPAWLRELLAGCDGRATAETLVGLVPPARRADAAATLARLHEERVLEDGTAEQAHAAVAPGHRVVGEGPVAELLRDGARDDGAVEIFVQDRLDHAALLAHNAAALAARRRWMWVSTGPGGRALVGPLFVPDAGPCAACLVLHFKRLSPVPALYDLLIAHVAGGGSVAPSPFPPHGAAAVAALARWKLALAVEPLPRAALYALHVVDAAELTTSAHAPLTDPECAVCAT